jgi:hypothetical protein
MCNRENGDLCLNVGLRDTFGFVSTLMSGLANPSVALVPISLTDTPAEAARRSATMNPQGQVATFPYSLVLGGLSVGLTSFLLPKSSFMRASAAASLPINTNTQEIVRVPKYRVEVGTLKLAGPIAPLLVC